MEPRDVNPTFDLVERAQHGDRAALDRLFQRYQQRVLGVVRRRLGRRLRQELDSCDIVQESFAVALRKFPTFEMRHEASLIAWLKRIVERKIVDAADRQLAGKRDRAREVSIDGSGDSASALAIPAESGDDWGSPLQRVVRREEQELVESYLAELPGQYRDLILLRNYEALDWERIAKLTDRPSADAARMMYAKALLELGRLIRRLRRRNGERHAPTGGPLTEEPAFGPPAPVPPRGGCET